jgi:Type VI secretion system, TssN
MNATGIALKVASLVFAGGIFMILFKRIKVLKKYGVASIVYVLLISILLALPTLLNLFEINISNVLLLVCAQVFILILGILHVSLTPSTLPWYKNQQFSMQLLFIICILFLAYFFSNMSLSFLVNPKLRIVWYLSLLWFLIPVLLNQTVEELLKVPPKIFKQWYYPLGLNIEDPSDEELENPIVISFVFQKNENSPELTTFRAKAPVGMKLGRLFYFFINDYNSRHPEGTILFLDSNRAPYGWVFMKIKNKFFNLKEGIDPESSIYVNEIRENDVLVCDRITKMN